MSDLTTPKLTADMKRPTNEQVQEALQILILAGRFSYKEEAKPSSAECLGQAVSGVTDNCNFLIEAAAEHCEDWNGHGLAKHLRDIINGTFCVPHI